MVHSSAIGIIMLAGKETIVELKIALVVAVVLFIVAAPHLYPELSPLGLLLGLAGVAVLVAGHALGGSIFKQLVPKWVVKRILRLDPNSQDKDVDIDGPVAIVACGMAGTAGTASLCLDDVYNLRRKIFSTHGSAAIGLAVSREHDVVLVNMKALEKVQNSPMTRLIVNDWKSLTGAFAMQGYRWIEVEDWISIFHSPSRLPTIEFT